MAGFDPLGALAGIIGGGLGFMVGGPLGAAAGSGLATTAYTGDLGRGILSGLMSYGLGSAGELLAEGGSQVMSSALPTEQLASTALGETVPAGMGAGLEGTMAGGEGSLIPPGEFMSGAGGGRGIESLIEANRTLKPWEMGARMDRIGAGLGDPSTLKNTFLNHGLSTTVPIGLGAYGMMEGAGQGPPPPPVAQPQQYGPASTRGTGRQMKVPGPEYRPGVDPEFRYFADGGEIDTGSWRAESDDKSREYRRDRYEKSWRGVSGREEMERDFKKRTGIDLGNFDGTTSRDISPDPHVSPLIRIYADGGEVDNESLRRQILIKNARKMGIGQASREAKEYDARKRAMEGRIPGLESENPFFRFPSSEGRYARGGYISGPGGGIADAIPAVVDGRHPAALSSGEYVIPAHAVSALGDGSSEEGTRQLNRMVDGVMKHKYGTKNRQPRPMKKFPSKFGIKAA